MYEAFYGFKEKPFNLTPDPKFLYLSRKHNEAFAHLEFGLRQRGGFMVVTGEVGTGKTTLCRYFLDRLDEDTVSAFILYPSLGTTDLLRSINRELGIDAEGTTDKQLVDRLHSFLLESRQRGKNIVVVIDEAQNLSRDVLEQVRLISNLETNTEKLIQIVLIGQSELNDKLAHHSLRQLAQRVTARYHLTPLSRQELTQYIRHRLAVAGGIGEVDFTSGALRRIHRFSKGIPRLTNLICDRALLAGYVLEVNEITGSLVKRAAKELRVGTSPGTWLKRAGWAAAILALVAFGVSARGVFDGKAPELSEAAAREATPVPLAVVSDADASPAVSTTVADVRDENDAADARRFEMRLVTLSRDISRQAAAAALLERWNVQLGGGASALSSLAEMPLLAERAALEYLELDSSVAQLRALDMPAVLELTHPSDDVARFVTLTSLNDTSAVLNFAPGDDIRVPVTVLTKFWTGRARFFWRDFEALASKGNQTQLDWAKSKLSSLGIGSPSDDLSEGLKLLQRKAMLDPDGRLGPRTRMALYSFARDYRVPRLLMP